MRPPRPPHPNVSLQGRSLTPDPEVNFHLRTIMRGPARTVRVLLDGLGGYRVDEMGEWDGEGEEEVEVDQGGDELEHRE